jgi:UDP-glucose 4-epimerase
MARAIEWACIRQSCAGGRFLRVNVGTDKSNQRVRDLAAAVAALVPGTTVNINTAAPFDARSYRVNFDLFRELAPDFQPEVGLDQSISEILAGLRAIGFDDANFRQSRRVTRLKAVSELLSEGKISAELRWIQIDKSPVAAG